MDDIISKRKEKILEIIKKSEFIEYMDLEFVELDVEHALARIPFKSKFLNPYGSVHGGFLYSIADTVAGSLAAMDGVYCTTADGSLNFFEPAIDTEYVYCYAKCIRCGKHLVNVRVEIRDDNDKLLDDGSFNYFKLKGNPVLE